MSFKRLLSILLATAMLCVNGLCLPVLAEEEVVEAEPVEKLPEWHAAAGEKAWIMTDEIKISAR